MTDEGLEAEAAAGPAFVGRYPAQRWRTPLQKLFDEAHHTDPFPTEILNCLSGGTRHHKKITLVDCRKDNGHLTYRTNMYVAVHEPLRLHLIQEHYDPPPMGQLG